MPNIWYRARLVVEPEGLDVSGVSLPGVPLIVAGSNRHVAWGFTNSYGDFQDVIRLERGPDADSYLTPAGPRRFESENETLLVAGGEPVTFVVRKTIWGPVIYYEEDVEGHELAVAWTAHRPGATDMEMLRLERAIDLDTAAAIIGGAGMPGTERDDRGRARPHRLGALGPAAAAPGHRSFAPVGLAHGRRGLGRLDPAR